MGNLSGVVLCGGMSSRMGTDKGMIKQNSKTWAEESYSKLAFFSVPVFVSVNHSQVEEYENYFLKEILVEDEVDAKGPLKGILSVHKRKPLNDLFVLACDMPLMNIETLNRLYQVYLFNKNGYNFFCFQRKSSFEPLCAIYTAKGLLRIFEMNQKKELNNYSMRYILETGKTFGVPVYNNEEFVFENCNEPIQLKALII